jgi:hypothetical protein
MTSETSVNFYQTTRCNNPEDSHLNTRRRASLKSHLGAKYSKKQIPLKIGNFCDKKSLLLSAAKYHHRHGKLVLLYYQIKYMSSIYFYLVCNRILLTQKHKRSYFLKKKKERQSDYIIYFVVHKQNEFLKPNLKPKLSECSKVILCIIRDMI